MPEYNPSNITSKYKLTILKALERRSWVKLHAGVYLKTSFAGNGRPIVIEIEHRTVKDGWDFNEWVINTLVQDKDGTWFTVDVQDGKRTLKETKKFIDDWSK